MARWLAGIDFGAMVLAAWLLAVLIPVHLLGQEWSRFRGENGAGESEARLAASWGETDYLWRIELPGKGHSSPVVWGERLFVTAAKDEGRERLLLCYAAATGRELWRQSVAGGSYHVHVQNSFASSTPAVDAERVVLLNVTPEHYRVQAFSHEGRPLWERDMGPFVSQHGFGTSPILWQNLIVANNDQDGESFLFALRANDGTEAWRVPRKTAVVAYSTPCTLERDGRTELLFNSEAHGISAVDALTGKLQWELEVFDKRSVSSPLMVGGLVIGSCGSGGGGNYLVAVRPGSKPELAFKFDKQAPYVPTSVAKGNLLFCWGDSGIVSCLRLPSGELVWQKRVGGNFSSSPVRSGDKLYCISVEGEVVVLAASETYQALGRVPLGDVSRATPAISGGRMFLRTESHLFCLPQIGPAR